MVVGTRMARTENMPWIRKKTNQFTSWVVSRLARQRIPDSQNGYRLYRTAVLAGVRNLGQHDWYREGAEARLKRVYRVDLDVTDGDGFLIKTLVCDLLDLADPRGLTIAEEGVVGLGPRFSFPFVCPESLVILEN